MRYPTILATLLFVAKVFQGGAQNTLLADIKRSFKSVKHIKPKGGFDHPRGWGTNLSHQRKLKSYKVESYWYESVAGKCNNHCRVPECYGVYESDEESLIILEDLDAAGFSGRKHSLSEKDLKNCISWLANFHARFMHHSSEGLWEQGTYWHLDTRPDELEVLDDHALKSAASDIDQALYNCKYKTLVHGDAKVANFCFGEESVAAVDFQYIGGGCGMKDLAYFVGSCLRDEDCEKHEDYLLDLYFDELRETGIEEFEAIEKEWRRMYDYAWADFHRFLKGWSPGHWKINSYSERIVKKVLGDLNVT